MTPDRDISSPSIDQIQPGHKLRCEQDFECIGDFGHITDFCRGEIIDVISVQNGEVEVAIGERFDHLQHDDLSNFSVVNP